MFTKKSYILLCITQFKVNIKNDMFNLCQINKTSRDWNNYSHEHAEAMINQILQEKLGNFCGMMLQNS